MKHLLFLCLIFCLSGCNDLFEDTIHYSQRVTQSKDYPVYLDMSEIGKIQSAANSPVSAPFKIVSNDRYYFVGDMLKGIHVYEKKASGVSYLCFIECKYLKAFELVDNRIFCNNLVDLVVIDVNNPLQVSILYRGENYFNRFKSYVEFWNLPYKEGKGVIAGTERHELTGTVTDRQPNLDFSELDQQYGNLTSKTIPDNWFSNHPEYDKPYIGMIKLPSDEIYSYGSYNSWFIWDPRSGNTRTREVDLWTTPRGNYTAPYYYSGAYPVDLFLEDSIIYHLGTVSNLTAGYCDCICYGEQYSIVYQLYFQNFKPLDICYMPQMKAFFTLSGTSIWGVFIKDDAVLGYKKTYKDYHLATNAEEIFRVGDKLLTLGNELSVYAVTENEITLVKRYPSISGKCCKIEQNQLAVANTQGLFLYDITDLQNIQSLN